MTAKMRVAIVSTTGSGRKRTIPALVDSTEVEVSAVHGRSADKITELASTFGVEHAYTDLEQLAAEREFDFVMLCSPPFMHKEQAEFFLDRKVPLLIEKPVAHTESDAQAIKMAAEAAGVEVRVAHHLRHQPAFQAIADALQSGSIGTPLIAEFQWSFKLNPDAPSSLWKLDPKLNGPTSLTDAGIHCIDAAVGLFGPGELDNLKTVTPTDRRTAETCVLQTQHGRTSVTVIASRIYGPYTNNLRISGTSGYIVGADFFTETSSEEVTIFDSSGEATVTARGRNPYAVEVEDFARLLRVGEAQNGTTLGEAVAALSLIQPT